MCYVLPTVVLPYFTQNIYDHSNGLFPLRHLANLCLPTVFLVFFILKVTTMHGSLVGETREIGQIGYYVEGYAKS